MGSPWCGEGAWGGLGAAFSAPSLGVPKGSPWAFSSDFDLEIYKSPFSVAQDCWPLVEEGSRFPGSRWVRSCQACWLFLPGTRTCPPGLPGLLGVSLQTLARGQGGQRGAPRSGETFAAADKGLGAWQGLAGAVRVIWRATRCQPISCRYRLVAASGTGLGALKTPSGSQARGLWMVANQGESFQSCWFQVEGRSGYGGAWVAVTVATSLGHRDCKL